jgi:hypothetical protein
VAADAIVSDELRGAFALSLYVDKFKLEGGEGGLGDLVAALAESTTLKQLCSVQVSDRNGDDASARFCTQLLLWGRSLGDSGWLRDKTIYPTYAFSISLRNCKFASPSTTNVTFTSSVVQVFPVMHMFTFVDHQREDVADIDHQNSHYYDIIPICMPAHTSHPLKPLDVGCFAVSKRYYGSRVVRYTRLDINFIEKDDFIYIFPKARGDAIKETIIRSAFATTGLVPFDPNRVLSRLNIQLVSPTLPDRSTS